MAGKSDYLENALLKLIFNATPIAYIADNAATTPLTNLYLSLHTADPGDSGGQTTNETVYAGYARVALARTSGGWTVTGNIVKPAATVEFAAAGTGTTPAVITHVGIGVNASAAGNLIYSGALTPNISVVEGVIPRLTTASSISED